MATSTAAPQEYRIVNCCCYRGPPAVDSAGGLAPNQSANAERRFLSMKTAELAISEHIACARYEALPPDVVALVKEKLLDTIGTMIAGSSAIGCDLVESQLMAWGGRPESTVVVTGARLPAPHAAQIHAMRAHADEYCDNDDRNALKASATVIPVSLALAEAAGASGKDLILAIALGIDLGCRIGLALNPAGSGIGRDEGVFSGAVAGAKLLGLGQEAVLASMSIGYTQLGVARMGMAHPSLTKRLIPGQVARAATWAAVLASSGFMGDSELLQGPLGYYRLMRGCEGNTQELTRDLGARFEVTHCPKPYPSGRYVHPAVDAALALRARHNFQAGHIGRIVIRMSNKSMSAIGGGFDGRNIAVKRAPRGQIDAQTSAPYNVAVALLKGAVRLVDFSPAALSDAETLALTAVTEEAYDCSLDDWPHFITPAIVEIHLKGGQQLVQRVDIARGNEKRPLSRAEMRDKFWECVDHCAPRLNTDAIERAIQMLEGLEEVKDIGILMRHFNANSSQPRSPSA